MGIKQRILLLLLAVVLLTTVLVGALAFDKARGALVQAIGGALVNASVQTLDKIDRELAERHDDIQHWARLDVVTSAALGDVDRDLKVLLALDGIRKNYGHILGLLVTSSDGKVQAATDARLMGHPVPADVARRPGQAGTQYDGPESLSIVAKPALILRSPIELAEAQVPVGDLTCLIDFEEVFKILESVKIAGETTPWFVLLDSAGRPIAFPKMAGPQWRGRQPKLEQLDGSLKPAMLAGSGGFAIVRDEVTGSRDLVGFAHSRGHRGFKGLGWTLVYKVTGEEAFATIIALRNQVVSLGIALSFLVMLVGSAMAIQMVRPVERIAAAMKRVRDGDFDQSITDSASGEIGKLIESFNFMVEGLKDREHIRDIFSRHVSPVVARKLLSEQDGLALSGERRRATILFTDIRSFTTLSERLPAPEVVALLNEYFTEMVAVVFRYDGFVNKFIGDALMAVWGAPYDVPQATARAAFAALEMQQKIHEISVRRRASGLPAVEMGIGFTTGDVIAGKIGSPERMEYTVIGDQVNVASRVEGLTKEFGAPVMMSESSFGEIASICEAEALGMVKVKGREQPIQVYRLISMKIRPEDLTSITAAA